MSMFKEGHPCHTCPKIMQEVCPEVLARIGKHPCYNLTEERESSSEMLEAIKEVIQERKNEAFS